VYVWLPTSAPLSQLLYFICSVCCITVFCFLSCLPSTYFLTYCYSWVFFFVISNRTGTKITDNSNASSSRPITHLQASKPASLTVSSPTKSTNADIMNALTDFRAEFLSNSKAQSDASSSQFRQLKGELGRLVSQVSEVRKLSITERGCYS